MDDYSGKTTDALRFRYSIESETTRVEETLKRRGFYRQNGYQLRLPEGIGEVSTRGQIASAVGAEYSDAEYARVAGRLRGACGGRIGDYLRVLGEVFGHSTPQGIDITLTKYGSGGSYDVRKGVILNFAGKRQLQMVETLMHEVMHLQLEHFMVEYGIPHWQKERIVDLMLHHDRFKSAGTRWQDSYHGAEQTVDPLFQKHLAKNADDESLASFFKELSERNRRVPQNAI